MTYAGGSGTYRIQLIQVVASWLSKEKFFTSLLQAFLHLDCSRSRAGKRLVSGVEYSTLPYWLQLTRDRMAWLYM